MFDIFLLLLLLLLKVSQSMIFIKFRENVLVLILKCIFSLDFNRVVKLNHLAEYNILAITEHQLSFFYKIMLRLKDRYLDNALFLVPAAMMFCANKFDE